MRKSLEPSGRAGNLEGVGAVFANLGFDRRSFPEACDNNLRAYRFFSLIRRRPIVANSTMRRMQVRKLFLEPCNVDSQLPPALTLTWTAVGWANASLQPVNDPVKIWLVRASCGLIHRAVDFGSIRASHLAQTPDAAANAMHTVKQITLAEKKRGVR
ncbi:MAG TPA: hypothetical protein VGW40_12940 [Allosphingosinicella sp.]|nr:hypothetical protein [Allosphingosinicella sp.]